MIIAFTLGQTEIYNQLLIKHPDQCFKLGETPEYQGGWVWKTAKEATTFLFSPDFAEVDWGDEEARNPKDFSVFKVHLENGWDDVSPIPGKDGIYHLKVSSRFSR